MKQQKFQTGMYIVDDDFRIVNINQALSELYPNVKVGDYCYEALALNNCQCEVCPLKADNALFYNPIRKEWISANATEMDYPGHGKCYNVQFQLRQRISEAGNEEMQEENMEEHILELSGGNPDVCVIGGYCDLGSPLSYANRQLLDLLGYETIEEFSEDIDGLVANSIHPDDLERVTNDLTKCAMYGGNLETTYRMHKKDKSWFWIVGRGKRVETKNGMYALLVVITDMTEFVKRQSLMTKENENLLKKQLTSNAVLSHMPGGYHRCANAPGWPFLYFGKSFEDTTGWSKEEIEGVFNNLFVNMVLEEDIPLCAGIIEDIETNGYSNAIYRLKKKGGGHIWVSDSTMRVSIGDETFFQGTLADVSPQIEAIEQAKSEAEASNLAKSTFLFNISHDIRTPMNAIKGFTRIIRDNPGEVQTVAKTIEKIDQATNTLMTLMDDVLDLSRIERGKEELNLEPVQMHEHGQNLIGMFDSEMKEAGIHFVVEAEIAHTYVMCDPLKLTRIGMNMLSNAKKFTPSGGTVTFGIREIDCDDTTVTYHLYTRDTGIGMSPEFLKRAFEQFERERTSTESGISGSGLGLAIIKRFVELMGGTVTIESEQGKGTEISAVIPFPLVMDKEVQRQQQEIPRPDVTGKRVLLVEDNDFNREIARYVLETMQLLVEEAENGAVCIDKLLEAEPGYYDLILMDLQMPVMNGYTATVEIRSLGDRRRAEIPIVAMTANAFDEDKRKCLEVGMNGHIGKPIEMDALFEALSKVFQ